MISNIVTKPRNFIEIVLLRKLTGSMGRVSPIQMFAAWNCQKSKPAEILWRALFSLNGKQTMCNFVFDKFRAFSRSPDWMLLICEIEAAQEMALCLQLRLRPPGKGGLEQRRSLLFTRGRHSLSQSSQSIGHTCLSWRTTRELQPRRRSWPSLRTPSTGMGAWIQARMNKFF